MTEMSKYAKFIFVDPDTDCWLWTGSATPRGYGVTHDTKRSARREIYQEYFGKLSSAVSLSSTCGNAQCVNPDHTIERRKAQMTENANRAHTDKPTLSNLGKDKDFQTLHEAGLTNKQIASVFNVALSTVKTLRRKYSAKKDTHHTTDTVNTEETVDQN